jgi:hypothetical protein
MEFASIMIFRLAQSLYIHPYSINNQRIQVHQPMGYVVLVHEVQALAKG